MAGRKAGDIWVAVHPDASFFGTRTREEVKKAVAGIKVDVPVTADTKPAIAQVEALKTRMVTLGERLAKLRLTADGKQAEAVIAKTQAKLAALAKTVASITMKADTTKLDAQIAAEQAKLRAFQQQAGDIKIDADAKAALSKIADLELAEARLEKRLRKMKGDLNIAAANAKLDSIRAQLAHLNSDATVIRLKADKKSVDAAITATKARIAELKAQASDIKLGGKLDTAGLLAAEATLLGLEGAFGKVSEESALAKTAMNAFFSSTGRGSTFAAAGWKLLTGHITLFGGALNQVLPRMFTSVAVWHLLADAVIELVAVWAPAILAVTAFGVAGADAAKSIFQRMQAVHTVMDATGKAVPPLTDSFKHLAAAVKPEVYQLFGDALVIMGKRGGAFNTVATETGRVIDQLAARFVVAVTSGSGVNKFMENAVTDVRLLGDSIGNLGGIFGAVFKAVPGYAEILLQVGDAITKVLETAVQAAEPVIAVGLALHGFFIYGGAAVTVALALVASLVKVGAAFGKFNEKILLVGLGNLNKFRNAMITAGTGIAGYAGELLAMAGAQGKAAAGTKVLADAQRLLTKIPTTVWVIAAATALASLVFAIARSKDAAQKFNATLQETITNAPLASVVTTIQQAQVVTAARLADSTRKLNTAIKENTVVNAGRAGALNSNGTAIQNLDNASRHYAEGLGQLTDQQKLVTGRFDGLSRAYGGNTAALGILNAAGITTAQITDTNKDHWAQALIQVEATAKAYAAMGTQAGVLGNDLDVLGRTVTDQAQAVKKLNDAWSQFIGDVTGTQGAFDTVAQGFFTLQDHAGKLSFSLGKLKIKYADQKAAIDSLTPAGIALNQAFGEQVVNIDKLFASWRTAGLAGNLFTAGVKDAIGPLVKYAAGSQEATAQLVALAQEAGYQGPISMQALTKWLGNTHGATKRLKDITNTATAQEALLTGAMSAQGDMIANKLLGDINNAILAYAGVDGAVTAYGTALAKSGKGSDTANKAMTKAVAALVKGGLDMGSTSKQLGAVVAKTFGVSMPAAMKLVQDAMTAMVAGLPPAQKKFELFAISGLGRTRAEADKLWKKFTESNLGALAAKADTTRDKFDKLASKGLGITRDEADQLWKHLRLQYLDELGRKGDVTRGKFIQLAEKGLDYTRQQAQHLWDTLHRQQLTDAASKAGETKTQFEHLAAQLGVTKGYADRLWDSLHKISKGSPYFVVIKESGTGLFTITGPGIKKSQGVGGSGNAAGGLAGGGYIDMGSGPTSDDVPAMLSRGELVVPAGMVAAGAVDHLRGSLPGFHRGGAVSRFASGGFVPDNGLASLAGETENFHADFYNTMTGAMKTAMTRALKEAQAAAQAAALNPFAGITGVPSGAKISGSAQAAQNFAKSILWAYGWKMDQWPSLQALWTGESGWRWDAYNASSGATGIPQALPGSKMASAGADWRTNPATQIRWGLGYIKQVYGSPAHAYALWLGRSPHWYSEGGPVGMAGGGATMGTHQVTGLAAGGVTALRSTLAREQAGERAKYYGLGHSFATGPAKYRTKTVMSELHTLATRQAAEQQAYAALAGSGLTTTRLHHLGAVARSEARTAADKGLSKMPGGHPGFARDLIRFLGQISTTSGGSVPAGSTSGGGGGAKPPAGASPNATQIARQGQAWLNAWRSRRGGGYGAAWGPIVLNEQVAEMAAAISRAVTLSKASGLSAGQHKFWANAAADEKKRLAVLKKELAVEQGWRGQLGSTDVTLAKQIAAAKGVPNLAGNIKSWKSQIKAHEYTIGQISKMLGYSNAYISSHPPAPVLPKVTHTYGGDVSDLIGAFISSVAAPFGFARGGLAGMARGGMASFDRGGTLSPGANTVWNGTGRDENLVPEGGGVNITFEVASSGTAFDQFMVTWLKKNVKVRGGGDIQRAFGVH